MNMNNGLVTTIGVAALMVIGVACGDGDSTLSTAPTATAAPVPTPTQTAPSPREISLTEVISLAKRGEIESIEVRGDRLTIITNRGETLGSRKEEGSSIVDTLAAAGVEPLPRILKVLPPTPPPEVQPDLVFVQELRSEKERLTSPDLAPSDIRDLVAGNSAFAFDLYQVLSAEDGNLFYSPYSISLALAMTYAGARGETEQQMANTLQFILSQDRLHSSFNGLDIELAGRGEGAEGTDEEGFRLNIVNALWGQEDFEFLPEFLDLVAENYGAGLKLLDFVNAAEDSRIVINDWVSEQTEGRIEDLIPQDVIHDMTRLVLTNAIFFNAAWLNPFTESHLTDGPLHLLDGSEVMVPMMRRTAGFGLAKGDGYQAVELPYDGDELSMVILLPDTGQFEVFESSLDADHVDTITKDLAPKQVALTMPKFEFESNFSLANTLGAMGMPVAFISSLGPCTPETADFSGMTGTCELFITEIVHKAFVSVDEAGTEAAAATAVVLGIESLPPSVTIDRPFVFLIRDIETGAILFVGRVADPSA